MNPAVRSGFCPSPATLHMWPGITPHVSLYSAYALGIGSRKDKEKRDNMDQSAPVIGSYFLRLWVWVPEAGSPRQRLSRQLVFNEHLWEEFQGLCTCRHPGTAMQLSGRSRACLSGVIHSLVLMLLVGVPQTCHIGSPGLNFIYYKMERLLGACV